MSAPGLLAQLWLDRLEALGRQMPSDAAAHHAFVESIRGRWPEAGTDLETRVVRIRLGMAMVAIYSAASTAAAMRVPMAVPCAELVAMLPFRPLASERQIIEEQYARACREIDLGNQPAPARVQ